MYRLKKFGAIFEGACATCHTSPADFLVEKGAWDRLLAKSRSNTVFLTAGWLRACWEIFESGGQFLAPALYDAHGELLAAAILVVRNDVAHFLGEGPSDYLDFAIDPKIPVLACPAVASKLLNIATDNCTSLRAFRLRNVPTDNDNACALLTVESIDGWMATGEQTMPAPTMDASAFPAALKKQSLRRHERQLSNLGPVEIVALNKADAILPRLDAFFDQHIQRWADGNHPSQFLDPKQKAFYRDWVVRLDYLGATRYLEIRVNGELAASHLGFHHAGRFTWYKPTYDPKLAKISPGETLLKRLIEQAQLEGAGEFDFTIGDEAFKSRFATRSRTVVDIYLTRSQIVRLARRGYRELRRLARIVLRRKSR